MTRQINSMPDTLAMNPTIAGDGRSLTVASPQTSGQPVGDQPTAQSRPGVARWVDAEVLLPSVAALVVALLLAANLGCNASGNMTVDFAGQAAPASSPEGSRQPVRDVERGDDAAPTNQLQNTDVAGPSGEVPNAADGRIVEPSTSVADATTDKAASVLSPVTASPSTAAPSTPSHGQGRHLPLSSVTITTPASPASAASPACVDSVAQMRDTHARLMREIDAKLADLESGDIAHPRDLADLGDLGDLGDVAPVARGRIESAAGARSLSPAELAGTQRSVSVTTGKSAATESAPVSLRVTRVERHESSLSVRSDASGVHVRETINGHTRQRHFISWEELRQKDPALHQRLQGR